MNALMVWKDGRRKVETGLGVGNRIIAPREDEHGRTFQTTFNATNEIVDDPSGRCRIFVEGETIDITDRLAEAERANVARRRAAMGRLLGEDEDESWRSEYPLPTWGTTLRLFASSVVQRIKRLFGTD